MIRLRVEKLTPLFQPVPILGQSVLATHVRDLISSSSVTVHSYPGPGKHLSYFKELLLPTYRSERCEVCHGFETKKKLRNHGPHGGVTINLEPSLFVPGAHVMTCSNCHSLEETNPYNGSNFQETEWRVPFVDLDTNWQTKSPSAYAPRTLSVIVPVNLGYRSERGASASMWPSTRSSEAPPGWKLGSRKSSVNPASA